MSDADFVKMMAAAIAKNLQVPFRKGLTMSFFGSYFAVFFCNSSVAGRSRVVLLGYT
jgi:hypothetical protein